MRFLVLASLLWVSVYTEPEYPKLIGCFSDSFVRKYHHRYSSLAYFDFMECHEQMSLYSAESRKDGGLCVDDIPENSEAVDPSLCKPCDDKPFLYCGGDGYVSVYQLRETVQRPLLLATDSGIRQISAYNASITSMVTNRKALAVDYTFRENTYYATGNKITAYEHYKIEYSTVGITGDHPIKDITVDWLREQLYWSSEDKAGVFTWLHGFKTKITDSAGTPEDLAVDPYERLLFFIDNGTVVSYNIDGEEVTRRYIFGESVVRMCVDHHEEQVYGIVDSNNKTELLMTDYNNTVTSLVFSGPELTNSVKMRVFHGELVWIAHDQDNYTLYLCRLSPQCDRTNLTIVLQTAGKLNDVKFFSTYLQTPSIDYACKQLNCSHTCTAIHMYTVKCTCPPGMELQGYYGNICEDKKVETSTVEEEEVESHPKRRKESTAVGIAPSPAGSHRPLIIMMAIFLLACNTTFLIQYLLKYYIRLY